MEIKLNKRNQLDTPFLDALLTWKPTGTTLSPLEELLNDSATELRSLRVCAEQAILQNQELIRDRNRLRSALTGGDECDNARAVYDSLMQQMESLSIEYAAFRKERK